MLPEFFENEYVASLPCRTRLFLIGLYLHADRAGRMEERVKQFRIHIFPYAQEVTDADVEEMLQVLSIPPDSTTDPLIVRYETEGRRFIEINKFKEHQSFHPKEKPSELPAPERLNHANIMHDPHKLGKGKGKSKSKSILKEAAEKIEQFVDLYHRLCPSRPAALKLTPHRMGQISRLLDDLQKMGIPPDEYLRRIEASDILCGRKEGFDWPGANLDFIIGPRNCIKIAEGYYDNKQAKQQRRHAQTSGPTNI